MRRSRLFGALTFLLLTGCPGVKPIKELLDDPSRFDGKTVRIVGDVRESIGALGVGAYQINDGTGTITVVSKAGNGTPRNGARVGVEGKFRSAFTLGPLSVAVIMEDKRRSP